MSVQSFRVNEVKEFDRDIECINKLMKLVKAGKVDSNIVYELCYYKEKFTKWLNLGVMDSVVRLGIEDILGSLDILLDSFSVEKLNNCYFRHSISEPLYYYDKQKYKGKNKTLKPIYLRSYHTKEYDEMFSEMIKCVTNILLYIPLLYSFVLMCALIFTAFVLKDNYVLVCLVSIPFFILLAMNIYVFVLLLYYLITHHSDSKTSYNTGVYKLQQPNEYSYTLNTKGWTYSQYVYDKVDVVLDILSIRNNWKKEDIWNLWCDKTALQKFLLLADVEVDEYYKKVVEEQVYTDSLYAISIDNLQFSSEW